MSEELEQELLWVINHEEVVSTPLKREEIIEIYKELDKLHSIIKEARELIKKEQQHYQRRDVYINANDFLEILDKVEENK